MSSTQAQPEPVSAAANRLAGLGSGMRAKNIAAVPPTAGLVPAAADEVSALIAAQFATQAQIYQAASAQVSKVVSAQAAVLELFASALMAGGGSDWAADGTDAATDL